jgi:hypothetical protein
MQQSQKVNHVTYLSNSNEQQKQSSENRSEDTRKMD